MTEFEKWLREEMKLTKYSYPDEYKELLEVLSKYEELTKGKIVLVLDKEEFKSYYLPIDNRLTEKLSWGYGLRETLWDLGRAKLGKLEDLIDQALEMKE
jgi:hypothetical protein